MRPVSPYSGVNAKGRSKALCFALQMMLCLVALLMLGNSALAQGNGQGLLSGTVTDPTGAVLVGAQVTITNVATGVTYANTTNSTGYFETDHLNPGTYKVSVVSPGFTNLVRTGIILEAEARLNIPLKLTPGATQTVTVSTDATQLITETASFGQVLTTQQVQDLTVSGSNPTWLALIAPGTQANVSQAASTGDGGGLIWSGLTQDFGTMGQIGKNEFSLDGAPNMTGGRQIAMNQSPDAVGEMKMDVNGYDASIGHTLGVNVTATTKGGTNNLHGSIREAYTATRWQGQNTFQALNYKYQQSLIPCTNGATTNSACYALENKFGNPGTNANNADVSVGGPVYIPGVIKGRNKFFFFFSGIVDNFAGAGGGNATLPTTQERGGNFTDYPTATAPAGFISGTTSSKGVAGTCPTGTPYYGQYQLYNPYSTVIDSSGVPRRTPLCGNVIPSGMLVNSAMTNFYNGILPTPTPNSNLVNPGAANYPYTSITPQTFRDYTTREDWKISPKNDLFARYAWQRYTKATNSPFADPGGNKLGLGREAEDRYIQLASIGWDYIINDRTNLDVTLSGTGYKNTCCFYPGYDALKPSTLGLPSYTDTYAGTIPAYVELPVLSINSYTGVGNNGSPANDSRDFRLSGNITRVMGRHTLRAGAEGRLQDYSQIVNGSGSVSVNGANISTGVSGSYAFDNTYTRENNGTDSAFPSSNSVLSYASFLMGVHTQASVVQNSAQSFQTPYYGVYADDTWRVTPRLTLVPGLRFELEDGLVEKHNHLVVGWDPNADLSLVSGPANAAYAATLAAATPAQLAVLPTSLTIKGGPMYAAVGGNPRNAFANSYRFMPRLGVTYQLNPRMVLRAGYGLFYDTMNALSGGGNQDGFSTSTTAPSSSTFGTNFTPGVSPLSDPFPASGGARFNSPIGSAAAQYYYLGAGPTITDHALPPARENRGSIGVQIAFSSHTVLDASYNMARTTHLSLNKNNSYTPQQLFSGGQQTNTATATLLGQLVPNPFYIGNLGGLASGNPAAYSNISHNSYYTSQTISVGNLVRAYPQMSGFTEREPLGSSNFQELLLALTHRMSHGISLTASFEVNDQHDKDFFWDPFDPLPSSEPSNASEPTRFTLEEVWKLPFGRGNAWATSGWKNALFGGFQIDNSYELQPGVLVGFGNLFYQGNPTGSAIKIGKPIWVINQATGGPNYIQWLNPGNVTATLSGTTCTYTGTGFVTNSSCQPNGQNLRVFAPRINGVRAMGMNNVNGNVARTFHLWESVNLETTFLVYNVFNHQGFGGPNASPTNGNFGRVTGDGFPQAGARWIYLQGRLSF